MSQSRIVLPTIQAIVDVCAPLVEIMVKMQGSRSPTIHLVAPRLLFARSMLRRMQSGLAIKDKNSESRVPSATAIKLSGIALEVLQRKLLFHPIYAGSVLLHPLLATFSWIPDRFTRDAYVELAKNM